MNAIQLKQALTLPLGKSIEKKLVEQWSTSFWKLRQQTNPMVKERPKGSHFTMMLPPPNITGNLHMGHALTASIQDALIRQRRMRGKHVTWIPGFDHAGLATQRIVEKLLWHQQGLTRKDITRDEFIAAAEKWKEAKLNDIKEQLVRFGLALDNQREYFTMDEKSSLAVHAAFKQLFNSGTIYRAMMPVYYSNELQTTLSDVEVDRVDGVDRYFRTGEVVVKKLTSQWFIDTKRMAMDAVKAVQDQSIDIIPPNYKKSWSAWLVENGVRDWCISRQSWWGHRIPAFKLADAADVQENWVVADSLDEAKEILKSEEVVQDDDVLDTWFSSSLLPLTVAGWPNKEQFEKSQRDRLFPLDIMETGFDILSYWVTKMVMISIALENKIPFKLILLHGMICDSDGKKMSKTKGNVMDPLHIIDGASLWSLQQETKSLHDQGLLDDTQLQLALKKQEDLYPMGMFACGSDGLRAYLLSHDYQEEIVRISTGQIDKVRRLENKIWNIFRLIGSVTESYNCENTSPLKSKLNPSQLLESKLNPPEIQLLKALAECVIISHDSFEQTYQLHRSFFAIEDFLSIKLSQKYLKQSKKALMTRSEMELQVMIMGLVTAAKLLHPFMPNLTEFLYQRISFVLNENQFNLGEASCLSFEAYPDREEWVKFLEKLK